MTLKPRLSSLVLLLLGLFMVGLLALPSLVDAHGDDMGMDDDDDDHDGEGQAEEARRKRQFLLVFHAVIASIVVWITMPISTALVAGKKAELHRTMSSANTLALCFVGLIAGIGFADGSSWHAKIAFLCLGAWVAQAAYGWIRHYFFRATMPIKPHRSFGIVLFVLSVITWTSGVLHVMGSCNAPQDVQMCNAHFYLGALFVIVGLVNGYYAPEFAAKAEMCLIAFGGLSELVGEGVVDSILNAIDPKTFEWNSMAKMLHLSAATVWVLSALFGWIVAIRRPTSLQRGLGLITGILFHLVFMFSHGGDASDRTKAAHLVHELALIPVLITRPSARMPKITSYLLTISGFAFIMAADPVTRDVPSFSPVSYVFVILLFATIFHAVHGFIRQRILRKDPSETMLERTGWAQPVYWTLRCFGKIFCCCCPGITVEEGEITKISQGSKYQHLEAQATPDEEAKLQDIDEDVTSPPAV